ncbi:hypothetical protein PR202_ga21517 [Eleusine coracana subsp. coracana]|uniref:Uncharacterized protein n=1 Tax=Eleusine coracana subsp. coracana TaxID=191504 RepID=A0AAV5D162_ELECO|nr:hypothetical protein PR202_ga21517 [Eleusine coracana subsp. coracana]
MRFEGPLDDALLGLQDLFEAMLLRLKHPAPPDAADEGGDDAAAAYELGTDEEVEAAARMATTLAANDCLDICLDIYVNVRDVVILSLSRLHVLLAWMQKNVWRM